MCKTAYYHIKKINKIRKYLTDDTTKTLVHSLVTGRLDYCNSLYFGLASKSTYKLQLAQNSAARIISKTRKHEHISPIFEKLHWLPINKRAVYKRMVLTFNSLHRNGPAYIKTALNWYTPQRDQRSRNIPSLIPVKSRSIRINNRLLQGGCVAALDSGIASLNQLNVLLHWQFLKNNWKHIFSRCNDTTDCLYTVVIIQWLHELC